MKNTLNNIIKLSHTRSIPLRVAAGYAVVAAVWIVCSDTLLGYLTHNPEIITHIEQLKGLAFVVVTATSLYLVIRHYLHALLQRDTLLLKIAEGVSATTGEAYFTYLVRQLAEAIGTDYAFVGELPPQTSQSVRTIAVFAKGKLTENFEYPLAGTPCAGVLASGACFYPEGVQTQFPQDRLLQQMNVDSYLGTPLRSANGTVVGLLGVMGCGPIRNPELAKSIFSVFAIRAAAELERKRAEETLEKQFRQISTIFDSLNAVVYVADMQSHALLFINAYGAAISGPEWEGKAFYDVLRFGEMAVLQFCPSDQLARDGQPLQPCVWEFEHPVNGRWYQCIDRAINWTDDSLVRMGIAVDITEIRKISQLKDEMISAVSHEMRTPLTAILGFTEYLLSQAPGDEERQSCLATILKESERLNTMIGSFLQLQRLSARVDFTLVKAVPVDELLRSSAAKFSGAPNHRIEITCPDDLPPVHGNPDYLQEMLDNLVSNAIKYSPKGGIVAIGAAAANHELVIWVRDEGIGISPELHEKIFERFFRIDNSDRRAAGGTGLGLALVREIVFLHGGTVRVESAPGKGSRFSVTLPTCQAAVEGHAACGDTAGP